MTTSPPDDKHTDSAPWRDLTTALPQPPDHGEMDLVWQELEAHFHWYDKHATTNRIGYQVLKVVTLLLGGVVTILAATESSAVLTASLAATIVAGEGIQQLFQLHANWISYRGTAEALRQQAFAYAARVDPYQNPDSRRARLVDAVTAITTTENTNWAKNMQRPLSN